MNFNCSETPLNTLIKLVTGARVGGSTQCEENCALFVKIFLGWEMNVSGRGTIFHDIVSEVGN